jgi:hypothetical protein
MSIVELKPLSEEAIQEMGYSSQDLWMIKLDDEILGPYEEESLKHYSHENEKMFLRAYATHREMSDWKPFFSHPQFKSLAQVENPSEVKFWILQQGQKVGPFSYEEIQKKIELGSLLMVDLISHDEGESWKKIFQTHEFQITEHEGLPLPSPPLEASFQRSRQEIVEKYYGEHHDTPLEGVGGLAFITTKDKLILKLEDVDMKSLEHPSIGLPELWGWPKLMASVGALALVGYFLLFRPYSQDLLVDEDPIPQEQGQSLAETSGSFDSTEAKPFMAPQNSQRITSPTTPFQSPTSKSRARAPSSFNGSNLPGPSRRQETFAPTRIETHQHMPQEESYTEAPEARADDTPEREAPQEHSLLSQSPEEGETLDNVMGMGQENSAPQPEAAVPVVEEVSDF